MNEDLLLLEKRLNSKLDLLEIRMDNNMRLLRWMLFTIWIGILVIFLII